MLVRISKTYEIHDPEKLRALCLEQAATMGETLADDASIEACVEWADSSDIPPLDYGIELTQLQVSVEGAP